MSVPHNIEAERAILGAIFLNNDFVVDVIDFLLPEDFYKPIHSIIYKSIYDCYVNGVSIDPISLIETMKKHHDLDKVGGFDAVLDILKSMPAATNVKQYSKIVKQNSILRQLIHTSAEIIEKASQSQQNVDLLLDEIENKIFQISSNKNIQNIVHIGSLVDSELQRLEKSNDNKSNITGIPSGFKVLDNMISGFQNSDLIVVGARPAVGKTTISSNFAKHASDLGKKVLFFSIEMSKFSIFQRFLSLESGVALNKLRSGFLNSDEWSKIGLATGKLVESNIFLGDTPNISVMEIKSICRKMKLKHGIDIVIIDYLQLIKGNKKTESKEQEISDVSRNLKSLAREIDRPIIVLSQLSRAPEQRSDKRPTLSDIRGSGSVEQDADVVIMLFRPGVYDEDVSTNGITEVIVSKHRNGPTGKVLLKFSPDISTFTSYL